MGCRWPALLSSHPLPLEDQNVIQLGPRGNQAQTHGYKEIPFESLPTVGHPSLYEDFS